MTASEFSNQFDVLYNNITSNQAPGLNEYEKSVFLSKAQIELIKNYFEAQSQGNTVKKGFDDSAIRQMDFSKLIMTNSETSDGSTPNIDPRSIVFKFPTNVLIVVNEQIGLAKDTISLVSQATSLRQVVPINYQEYMKLMSKPFKEPLKWQAWRLLNNVTETKAEVVMTSYDKSHFNGRLYILRYVKRPKPIILTDLSSAYGENLSIDGKNGSENAYTKDSNGIIANPCELDESTHEAILQRAVELAKISWGGDNNQIQLEVQAGQRSE